MGRMAKYAAVAVACLLLSSSMTVAAGEFYMWFGNASGDALTSITKGDGEAFDVYVWMTTSVNTWYAETAIGFDTTNSEGPNAIPFDRKITLANGDINSDLVWGDVLADYTTEMSRCLAGFYKADNGMRPYGADLSCAVIPGVVPAFSVPKKFAKLSLQSHLEPAESYGISLYSDSSGSAGGLSTLVRGNSVYAAPTTFLTVCGSVPQSVSIFGAQAAADDTFVNCSGVVTACIDGYFYIESTDRSSGIRVEYSGASATVDYQAFVIGTMKTLDTGERYILASTVNQMPWGKIAPLGMANKSLGGASVGSGLRTVGILVKTWGRIAEAGSGYVIIDDGSGVFVKVDTTGFIDIPAEGCISVVGISSLYKTGSDCRRLIVPRSRLDISGE